MINFYLIFNPNRRSDRQTNFKQLHGNIINNSITMKIRPFQQQQNYGNRRTHSIVMAEKKIQKKIWMWLCKKFFAWTKVINIKTISKICDIGSIYSPNKHSNRQTNFKMSDDNNINNGNTFKTKFFLRKYKYICSKVMVEHPLKTYISAYIHGWII